MDLLNKAWLALIDPFRYVVDHNERIYFGYLASAFLLAIPVYLYLRRSQPESVPDSLLGYLFPKKIYLHKSAIADYKFFLVDRVLYVILFPVVALLVTPLTDGVTDVLIAQFGAPAHPWNAAEGWSLAFVTLAQIAWIDFMLYYVHYLFHRIPALWEFHKVHHSAEVMTPITAYRVHPFELFMTMNITAIGTALLAGVIGYYCGGGHPELRMYGINVVQFAFYVIGFNLRHSHVPLGYGPVLSQVFVSPWMHQVHHSREARHFDKNMGFIFSFWDTMFGTLYVPQRGETFELGLSDGEHVRFHSLTALYFRPITNILRRWMKPAKVA
ncbi:MAG TPA: sterol desaturase family protein [Candidatus Binatia bacterium]|nr:sterol desaturase family protein [Candidatus Binatia bacterium]